jgi:uncharacterized membrane protein YkvI
MENNNENDDFGFRLTSQNQRVSIENNSNIYNMLLENPKEFQENFIGRQSLEQEDEENDDLEEKINSANYRGSRKTLMQRYFSKMDEGSLRASILSITSLALGPGCLSLASKFKEMGFFFTIMLILLGATAAYWSLKIMIIASKKMNVDEYGKCASVALGKYMGWFIDCVILFYIFGVLISYHVIGIF